MQVLESDRQFSWSYKELTRNINQFHFVVLFGSFRLRLRSGGTGPPDQAPANAATAFAEFKV